MRFLHFRVLFLSWVQIECPVRRLRHIPVCCSICKMNLARRLGAGRSIRLNIGAVWRQTGSYIGRLSVGTTT
jgi:hypothetical protein